MTSSAYDRMQAEGELARVQAGEYDWGAAEESRKRATEWALVSIAESLAVLAAPATEGFDGLPGEYVEWTEGPRQDRKRRERERAKRDA